ncbi:polymeric immunoglobulin receptor-like isoform X2 [Mobula hypostoma]|uniref:polymeric immunoglobulin receptor-like isoform X2 n=1 Tax=Mobula hypostoma TaxID=723540 RepID=UPI002FC3D7E6
MLFAALLLLSVISKSLTRHHTMVVRAGVGETVTVRCSPAEKRGTIVLCKTNYQRKCNTVVDTEKYSYHPRISIRIHTGSIVVTTRQLMESDSGIYWCGRINGRYIDVSDIVMLKVTAAGSWTADNTTVKGVMQTATSLHCHYDHRFKSYEKFLCKVTSVNRCSVIASSEYSSRNPAIIINTSTEFAVTIKHTNEGDKGEYWCGATNKVNFEIVQIKMLEISEETPENSKDNKSGPQIWYILLPLLLGLLVLLLIVLLIKKRRRPQKIVTPANTNRTPETSTTAKFEKEAEDTVTYSAVTIQPSAQTEGSSTIYSNMKDLEEQNGDVKIHSSESVEYSALLFRS